MNLLSTPKRIVAQNAVKLIGCYNYCEPCKLRITPVIMIIFIEIIVKMLFRKKIWIKSRLQLSFNFYYLILFFFWFCRKLNQDKNLFLLPYFREIIMNVWKVYSNVATMTTAVHIPCSGFAEKTSFTITLSCFHWASMAARM